MNVEPTIFSGSEDHGETFVHCRKEQPEHSEISFYFLLVMEGNITGNIT